MFITLDTSGLADGETFTIPQVLQVISNENIKGISFSSLNNSETTPLDVGDLQITVASRLPSTFMYLDNVVPEGTIVTQGGGVRADIGHAAHFGAYTLKNDGALTILDYSDAPATGANVVMHESVRLEDQSHLYVQATDGDPLTVAAVSGSSTSTIHLYGDLKVGVTREFFPPPSRPHPSLH